MIAAKLDRMQRCAKTFGAKFSLIVDSSGFWYASWTPSGRKIICQVSGKTYDEAMEKLEARLPDELAKCP